MKSTFKCIQDRSTMKSTLKSIQNLSAVISTLMANVYSRSKHRTVVKQLFVNSRLSSFKPVWLRTHDLLCCSDTTTNNNLTVAETTSHSIILLGEPIQLSFINQKLLKYNLFWQGQTNCRLIILLARTRDSQALRIHLLDSK